MRVFKKGRAARVAGGFRRKATFGKLAATGQPANFGFPKPLALRASPAG
jgi:hypothetical protein